MKDAKGHGSNPHGGEGGRAAAMADLERSGKIPAGTSQAVATMLGGASHSSGVTAVGQAGLPQKESPESRELRLFADNDGDLYRQSKQPIIDNLGKKMDKGNYDPSKAATLWGYHADRAAQSYTKQLGSPGDKWHQMFTPAVRKEAAQHWEQDERGDIASGSSRSYKPKK